MRDAFQKVQVNLIFVDGRIKGLSLTLSLLSQ